MQRGGTVKYSTLVKYDLVGDYLLVCTQSQKDVFLKEQKFYNMINQPEFQKNKTQKELENTIKQIVGSDIENLKINFTFENDTNKKETSTEAYTITDAIKDIKYNAVNKNNEPLKITTKQNLMQAANLLCETVDCESDFSIIIEEENIAKIQILPYNKFVSIITLIMSLHRYSVKFKTVLGKNIVIFRKIME